MARPQRSLPAGGHNLTCGCCARTGWPVSWLRDCELCDGDGRGEGGLDVQWVRFQWPTSESTLRQVFVANPIATLGGPYTHSANSDDITAGVAAPATRERQYRFAVELDGRWVRIRSGAVQLESPDKQWRVTSCVRKYADVCDVAVDCVVAGVRAPAAKTR